MSQHNVIYWNGQMLIYHQDSSGWTAHYLGDVQPVPISAELRAAIEADWKHQLEKRS